MGKNLFLIRSNLRKAKGQTVAELVLILLAAGMMNLWLMLSLDYRQNFVRCHDRLHGEHVAVCVEGSAHEMRDYISKVLEEDGRATETCMDSVMCAEGGLTYNGGETTTNFILMEKEDALGRPVGRAELVEDSGIAEGVYLPMIYKTGEIAAGKQVQLTIGSHKVSYKVCGFFNSAMAGSHNCGMCLVLLTGQCYQELEEKGYALDATLVSVRIKDQSGSEAFESMLDQAISAKYPEHFSVSNSYALVSQSRYISQMICSGILSAMAFFVLLIVVVVVVSNIINYIQENMKNIGVWKAMGYQSRQLVGMLQQQFLGIACLAALAGVMLSYCLFPALNGMMVSQTGIPYEVRFLPVPLLATLAVLCGAVAFAVWLPARRIQKITPIDALRQGVRTHSFQRNHIPLEGTRLPLNTALSLKTTLSGMKYNFTICITMLVLSLILVFSGLMLENVIVDMTPFRNLVVGETADTCININADAEAEFLQEMEKDSRVEKIYLYHTQMVEHMGDTGLSSNQTVSSAEGSLLSNICDDFSKVNNPDVIMEGRFPEFENEIAIAVKYAREQGLGIGDEIRLGVGKKEAMYLISGFTQISNNLGKDCLLTRPGYCRIGKLENLSYCMDLSPGVSVDGFNEEVSSRFGLKVNKAQNIEEIVRGLSAVYISLMTAIVAAILVLSVLIIVFVMYLLVRAMLGNKRMEYGILKALGFTTAQLMFQTALSFLPAVAVSTAVGLTISSFVINPLTAMFLRDLGIVKCTFHVPVGFVIAAGLGLVAFAFATACLVSLRVKKLVPRSLLVND